MIGNDMNWQRTFTWMLAGMGMLLSVANSASACPMCKMALEKDDPQPQAYMVSILFMMGTIFLLIGLVSALLYWVSLQERRAMEAAGYQHLFENAVSQTQASPATSAS